jgi:protein SDA1
MGMASGTQPLAFGHSADAAVDIEGLALLEDHLQKLRDEDNVVMDEDDEAAWDGWDVDSDSSDSDSDGWQEVPDDDEDLHISDSEDEDKPKAKEPPPDADAEPEVDPATRISTLATTKVRRLCSRRAFVSNAGSGCRFSPLLTLRC